MKLNYKIIFHFFGLLLLFNGGFMLLAALLSFFYKDGATFDLFLAGISVLAFGVMSMPQDAATNGLNRSPILDNFQQNPIIPERLASG